MKIKNTKCWTQIINNKGFDSKPNKLNWIIEHRRMKLNTNRSLLGMAQWWSNRLLRRSSSVLRVLVRPSVFLSSSSSWASVLALSLASVDVSYMKFNNDYYIWNSFGFFVATHINTFLFKGLRKGIAVATSAGAKWLLIIGYLQRANLSYNRCIWIR